MLIAAAIFEPWYQKIPNALAFPAILIALAYAGLPRGVDGLLFSTGGMAFDCVRGLLAGLGYLSGRIDRVCLPTGGG